MNKMHQNRHKTEIPDHHLMIGDSKNGSYLLSHLVGQYHRRGRA